MTRAISMESPALSGRWLKQGEKGSEQTITGPPSFGRTQVIDYARTESRIGVDQTEAIGVLHPLVPAPNIARGYPPHIASGPGGGGEMGRCVGQDPARWPCGGKLLLPRATSIPAKVGMSLARKMPELRVVRVSGGGLRTALPKRDHPALPIKCPPAFRVDRHETVRALIKSPPVRSRLSRGGRPGWRHRPEGVSGGQGIEAGAVQPRAVLARRRARGRCCRGEWRARSSPAPNPIRRGGGVAHLGGTPSPQAGCWSRSWPERTLPTGRVRPRPRRSAEGQGIREAVELGRRYSTSSHSSTVLPRLTSKRVALDPDRVAPGAQQ